MIAGTYEEVYARWLKAPENFWAELAEAVHWYKKWDKILDASRPPFYRWFTGGMVNTCYNALDRHVEQGRGNQPALIYDSPVTGIIKTFSYRELLDEAARFAGVLVRQGIQKGDRVIIYMSLMATIVRSFLCRSRIVRKPKRPIRPNPLIATLAVINPPVYSSDNGCCFYSIHPRSAVFISCNSSVR